MEVKQSAFATRIALRHDSRMECSEVLAFSRTGRGNMKHTMATEGVHHIQFYLPSFLELVSSLPNCGC